MIVSFTLLLKQMMHPRSKTDRIENCVGYICRWMNRNDLKLNEHKAEVVLISSKFRDGPSLDYVNIGNERILIKPQALE